MAHVPVATIDPCKALTDWDPLHTSLPELKGIFDSKIILNFYFFSPFLTVFS